MPVNFSMNVCVLKIKRTACSFINELLCYYLFNSLMFLKEQKEKSFHLYSITRECRIGSPS